MNLQFFVCFHKKIFHEIYKISTTEKKKYLTYYGVKDKETNTPDSANIIYEYELTNYNPVIQANVYNEGSCLYHVYTNNLYAKYDYIGFCQYDMIFHENVFKKIETTISKTDNIIYYLDFFPWAFLGGQTTIIKDYHHIPAGLKNYNAFFNKNYTAEQLVLNKMIICNTFLIPRKTYQKMMSWLIQYFRDDIRLKNTCESGYVFDPGHMIEALTSMFLALEINEGGRYEKLEIEHHSRFKV
jgi:hypothetical protein